MAVYTPVTNKDLEVFLDGFNAGKLISFKGIAEGVENTNFFVLTDCHRLILTLFEKRVSADDLPFFIGLNRHLAIKGLPVAKPFENSRGEVLHRLSGKPAALMSFLDGVSLADPGKSHCYRLGAIMAEMHLAGQDYTLKRKNDLGPEGWQHLITKTSQRFEEWRPGLGDDIAREYRDLLSLWPRDLPGGVIHADLFPDNVLFVEDSIEGLIDFYFACNDFFAYDLAVSLNAWCFDPKGKEILFREDKAQAMIEGYQSVRTLSREEKQNLPLLARGAALRFFLTRLYDWLHHDPRAIVHPHDPRPFYLRNHFFRTAQL